MWTLTAAVFLTAAASALVQSGAHGRVAGAWGGVFDPAAPHLRAGIVCPGERGAGATEADAANEARVRRIDVMLERNGFAGPPMQQVLRFVQLFAPLLIAPLGGQIAAFLAS